VVFKVLTILSQFKEIIIKLPVAEFKTIMVFPSVGRFYNMGEETEVVTKSEQGILVNFYLSVTIEIRQYAPVLP
jgi:hypothetical protein